MKWENLAKPCRNLCFRTVKPVYDPVSKNEKILFTSFTGEENGVIILVDTETLENEIYVQPSDHGAWGVLQLPDHSILIGSCTKDGAVQRFDMHKREWICNVKADVLYIWDFAIGSDGMVYCGTWQGPMLRYNPTNHELVNIGKTSDNELNTYSRYVFGQIPGKIYINCGFDTSHVTEYDIETGKYDYHFYDGGQITNILDDEIVIKNTDSTYQIIKPDKTLVFDKPLTFHELLSTDSKAAGHYRKQEEAKNDPRLKGFHLDSHKSGLITTAKGDIFFDDGQEYVVIRKDSETAEIKAFTVEPPATAILTLIADDAGMIWGSSTFGMTIFKYDPKTGKYWNSPPVSNNSGEVYGMVYHNKKLYMTAYIAGDHVVYDPSKPWDHRNNINPKVVHLSSPEYVRPIAVSIIDDSGYIWTGWSAKYGTREMAITRWDTKTDEVVTFEKIIPSQTIYGLSTDGENIWFTTAGPANGLPDIDDSFHLCAISKDGEIVFKKCFDFGLRPGRVQFCGKKGVVVVNDSVYIINADTFTLHKANDITIKAKIVESVTKFNETTVAIVDTDQVWFYDVVNEKVVMSAPPLKKRVEGAVTCGGEYYTAESGSLKKLVN